MTETPAAPRGRNASRGWTVVGEVLAVGVALAACVPVLTPLAAPGMSATHDGFLHVQRLIALEAVARDGAPFSRWLPDLAYGYGQPLLLYYAPLSYLPALAVRALGAGYIASFELGSGLALLLSALTMYLLGRAVFGRVAAVAAAIVYAALPYQLVDLYVRGALAESWAFAWMPLGALCLIRLAREPSPWWGTGLACSVAGLILTHNVTALLFLPALVVLALALYVHQDNPRAHWRFATVGPPVGGNGPDNPRAHWRFIVAALGYLGLGVSLSAWFWLPAIAERAHVQIEQTIEPRLFASFFLSGWPPFRPEPLYDYQQPASAALGYPIFWPQLGLVQALVALAGAVAVTRLTGLSRVAGIWAVALVLGGIVLQLRPLAFIYDLVPLLAFVQFPWRLLALVGLGSALLAGGLVEVTGARVLVQAGLAAAVCLASLITATGQLQPESTPIDERLLSVETIARAELADYGLGTTHSGEYLPVSSGQRNAARLRKTLLEAGSGVARTARPDPLSFQIERIDWRPDRITVDLTSTAPTPERLLFHQFAFDGWTAKVDGMTVRALAVGQLGLIGVNVSTGRHTVELTWSGVRTTMRWQGIVVSSLSLAALAFLLAARRLTGRRRWFVAVALGVGVATLLSESPGLPAQSASNDAEHGDARWQPVDDSLTLASVRHDTSRLAADRLLTTRLLWFARETPATGYRAALEAIAEDGTVHRSPWIYEPLSRLWERGEILPTSVAMRLPPGFPTGPARLQLAFDRPAGLSRILLGTVDVPAALAVPSSVLSADGLAIGDGIRVTVLADSSKSARAGSPVDVALRWQATRSAPDRERELLVVAALQGPAGEIVSEVRRPGDWFAPLPFWQAGDQIEQRIRLNLPPGLPAGQYPLTVRIYPRDLARGGAAEPGASSARLRGRPLAELSADTVTVTP